MTPAAYDAWYATPRGRWIGDQEFALLRRLLDAKPGETMLDVGCGTGYFTCRFAREDGLKVTGIDIDPGMISFAREKLPDSDFALGDAQNLPFADASFDYVVAVASLCFVADEARAVREMARVARRSVALGLLNRHSLLWMRKQGTDSYAGARWHRRGEARTLLANAGLHAVRINTAIYCPEGGQVTRWLEPLIPDTFSVGGFLGVAGVVRATVEGKA